MAHLHRGQAIEPLGPVDSAFYFVDDEKTPMNIGALTILSGKIPIEGLLKLLDERLHQAPIYRKRIVQAPFNLGEPGWVIDPEFAVQNHVFRATVPEPGTEEQLMEVAGRLVSGRLDRNRPLWRIYLIDGLSGGRSALLFKVHHCMVDGLSAVELFTLLFDLTPDPPPGRRPPVYDPPDLPSPRQLLTDAIRTAIPHRLKVVKKLGGDVGRLWEVVSDKERRRAALMGVANLINDNLRPIKKLMINGRNTGQITLAWAEFSLAEVRAIRAVRPGASVNEVMLTLLGAAVGRYLKTHHEHAQQDFLRVLVPVNMRMETEKGTLGNRIAVLPMDIPLYSTDPLERLGATVTYSNTMKNSSLSIGVDLVLTLPALIPAPAQPLLWGFAPTVFALLAHTWCTNVAGPQIPVYVLGQQMTSSYGFFPLNPSMGLACVILSYNQKITMTLIADAGIIPDVNEMAGYLKAAFIELRNAAKVPSIPPVVLGEVPKAAPEPVVVPPAAPKTEPATAPNAEPAAATPATTIAESLHVPSTPNGSSGKRHLFSEEWAQAYQQAINSNPNYYKASRGWENGPLAFIMRASPRDGYPSGSAVLLDLHKGECRAAHHVPVEEALSRAEYVIEGDYPSWMGVLAGHTSPLMLIIRGKLRLRKGSLSKLMPFTQSAQELVASAQRIEQ